MQFIKKLVILTGGGARGTLMLEKNSFGVWCRLNIFDLRPSDAYRFVILSGDDLFVMKIDNKRDQSLNFELGEIGFEQIHAAVVSDKVVMYGSNCATKLNNDTILQKVKLQYDKAKEENSITFSGRDKNINDYFKQIVPPLYNDFAIAEKNYYPAYVTVVDEVAAADEKPQEQDKPEEKIIVQEDTRQETQAKKETVEDSVATKKFTPHELEQRYLRLTLAAATLHLNETKSNSTEKVDLKKSLTEAEKPEVIAMARRLTLKDYRVEGAKPAGRKATYFERSSAQIEKLMASNERFTAIEKLIPGSKFVKINYDQKRFYIVGVIGRDYICYGVPSIYSEEPPEPLCGYAKWLPFDARNPRAEGFWMMYQDGISGETLKS